MKEKIEEKLNKRLELILEKEIENITKEDFEILERALNKIEFEENEEKRKQEYAELVAKALTR